MERNWWTYVFFLVVVELVAQEGKPELGGFTYTLFPALGDTYIEKYDLRLNGVGKIGNGFTGFGLSYSHYNFIYDQGWAETDLSNFETMHVLRLHLQYMRPLNKNWKLNMLVSPILSGNFVEGITSEDFQYNAFAILRKTWIKDKSQSSLSFGLAFGNFFGRPSFLPVASFSQIINSQWGFTIGIPKVVFYYIPAERHRIQFTADVDGLYGNNSAATFIPDFGVLNDTKLSLASFKAGLEHQFNVQRGITTVLKAGYAYNELMVEDDNAEKLFDFDAGGSAFFSIGLHINLNIFNNEKTGN